MPTAVPAERPKRPGVSTPGVRIPITKLKPAAIYQVPGAPDWMSVDKEVWVSNEPKNTVSRLDPASDAVSTFTVGEAPCSGLAAGFGEYLRSAVADGVHSGTGRTALNDDNTDYYPVPLKEETLRPGTVYADPYGHILVLANRRRTLPMC